MNSAFISGCASVELTEDERLFFRATRPTGLILFKRNCVSREQIAALVADFHRCLSGAPALVLIDQEGGRVQRMGPPHWPAYPSAQRLARAGQGRHDRGRSLVHAIARLMADDLRAVGITVDCLPVLDIPQPDADQIISDRAYGDEPEIVATLGRAACLGLISGGVLPVVKHIPGHGRARVDSHVRLPVVGTDAATLRDTDFSPFRALADMPLAMTAHVVYSAIDPCAPATMSEVVISEIIRGEIGFDGLLMSDDLGMGALSGSFEERTRRAIEAGCDLVLHCSGDLDEMRAVAAAAGPLTDHAATRLSRALGFLRKPVPFDRGVALEDLARLSGESV